MQRRQLVLILKSQQWMISIATIVDQPRMTSSDAVLVGYISERVCGL